MRVFSCAVPGRESYECTRPVSWEGGNGFQKRATQLAERSTLIALADTGLDGWTTECIKLSSKVIGHFPKSGTISVTQGVSGIYLARGLPVFFSTATRYAN